MAYVPKLTHLFKIMLRMRDRAAAEGLFLEGSIEYEGGDTENARLMFYYGTRLDPTLAGNFYNYAAATEKLKGPGEETIAAWEAYLDAATRDRLQPADQREKVRVHVAELKAGTKPPDRAR